VLFTYGRHAAPVIRFHTKSGLLTVARDGDVLILDFPSRPAPVSETPEALVRVLASARWRFVAAETIWRSLRRRRMSPVSSPISGSQPVGLSGNHRHRAGSQVDFVSRFFAPRAGIPEDPVTGSSHTELIPYWAQRLNKKKLTARQLSARGGELFCEDAGDRVKIGGRAVTYLRGEIDI